MSRRAVVLVLGLSVAVLATSYTVKTCPSVVRETRAHLACYTDIRALYHERGTDRDVFPYIHGRLVGFDLRDGAIEYPVLTGLFMWVAGLPAHDTSTYLLVSASLLAVIALAVAYALARMAGERALLWAIAPAVALYAFHNWDLLAVGASVAGFAAIRRERTTVAGAWFGVGAACKLYPAVFVLPLALAALHRGDRRRAGGALLAGVSTVAAINLPFAIASPGGWFATYQFHRIRPPNFDSTWELVPWLSAHHIELSTGIVNAASTAALAVFVVAVLWVGWRRASPTDGVRVVPLCGALVAAFMLTSKVQSPQFSLWLIPFFVLTNVSLWWWIGLALSDAVAFATIFVLPEFSIDLALRHAALVLRTLLLTALVIALARAAPRQPYRANST